jgi:Protein of unknown function (DUF3072)
MTNKSTEKRHESDELNPKIDLAANSKRRRAGRLGRRRPNDRAQASYLKTLSEEGDSPHSFETSLTKAEAPKRIDALKSKRDSVPTEKPR